MIRILFLVVCTLLLQKCTNKLKQPQDIISEIVDSQHNALRQHYTDAPPEIFLSALKKIKKNKRNIQRYLESEKIDLDEFAKVTFVSSIDFQHGTVCASFRFENQIIEFEMFLNSFTSTKGELNATSIHCLKQESANYLFNLNDIPNTTSLNMPITGQTESGGGLVTIIKKNEINSCFFLER